MIKLMNILNEAKESFVVFSSTSGTVMTGQKGVSEREALKILDRGHRKGQYHWAMMGTKYYNKSKWGKKNPIEEGKLKEDWKSAQGYSSPEAKKIMDSSLRDYAKQLRKVEYKIIKDWMSKAKSGVVDYFDVVNGLTQGDASRAHPEETQFLHKILLKDKILNRFRSYFGGKKGKPRGK
jgi:hypothetical protein